LVLRTGSRDLKPSQYDLDFGGTTPEEVAITAYKRLNSTDPVTFIVKNFDNGKFHTVVVTPAGAVSCVEKRDASRDEEPL
ncbi:MAG TPA: hypothetical protein VLT45_02460, partial [Kofleriaceae bacterium]|nr:hypothetical protein [Kofleriaceae bacterium]